MTNTKNSLLFRRIEDRLPMAYQITITSRGDSLFESNLAIGLDTPFIHFFNDLLHHVSKGVFGGASLKVKFRKINLQVI